MLFHSCRKIIASLKDFKGCTLILLIFAVFVTNSTLKADEPSIFEPTHHLIRISGFTFMPKELTVSIGDTITWINEDVVSHNVIKSVNKIIVIENLDFDEGSTVHITEGFSYFCGLHPSMTGMVILRD